MRRFDNGVSIMLRDYPLGFLGRRISPKQEYNAALSRTIASSCLSGTALLIDCSNAFICKGLPTPILVAVGLTSSHR